MGEECGKIGHLVPMRKWANTILQSTWKEKSSCERLRKSSSCTWVWKDEIPMANKMNPSKKWKPLLPNPKKWTQVRLWTGGRVQASPKQKEQRKKKTKEKKKKKKSRVLGISCWQARSYLVLGPMVEVWAKVPWRGGEGREEGRFGPSPMDGGRKGGRKEGEGRRSKKSVDIWEFWPRESEAGRRTHLRTLLHKASSRSTSAHLFLPTNCPPNSPHRLSLSLFLFL